MDSCCDQRYDCVEKCDQCHIPIKIHCESCETNQPTNPSARKGVFCSDLQLVLCTECFYAGNPNRKNDDTWFCKDCLIVTCHTCSSVMEGHCSYCIKPSCTHCLRIHCDTCLAECTECFESNICFECKDSYPKCNDCTGW